MRIAKLPQLADWWRVHGKKATDAFKDRTHSLPLAFYMPEGSDVRAAAQWIEVELYAASLLRDRDDGEPVLLGFTPGNQVHPYHCFFLYLDYPRASRGTSEYA